MGKNKDYELAIRIAGEVEKSFYESTKLTKKELNDIAKYASKTVLATEKEASDAAGKIKGNFERNLKDTESLFSGLESAARTSFDLMAKASLAAGAAITAGLVGSVHVGSEFESAFAGVRKTVNASNAELEQMRNELRAMAKDELPMSAAELSAIAESAGQLGIHNKNIIGFTETMANMDVATDLGSDEAASEFAKFANITEMSQDYFANLGSSVVALGNNMATTESDTVNMAMRIAAAGHQVKLSEADIMGYSAALSSVGIEAEAGGSAFSKLLTKLQLAAETGENLKDYAKVAGMTSKEFKEAFNEDATVAINAFLTGLTDTEQNGKSAIAVLDEMGLTEVRLRDTLLRAGNANTLFADALEISNTAWEENTALANEAEQRYKTFESQCQMTQNKITDIGISIYDDLRPGLTEGIGLVNEFIEGLAGKEDVLGDVIESATKSMPTMVRKTREAAEAVREFSEPFLKVGGFLVDHPGIITGTIAGIGSALAAHKIASGISAVAAAFGALNPVGMAFLGLGGVVAVFTGIATAVKKTAAEAKKANLDAHFGNIALSLSQLQEAAEHIVSSQELDKVHESIAAMSEAEGIADDIRAATDELNRMNWKVSVGMELTEPEQEAYREEIENFINSTQSYLTENQYAVNLAVGVLTDDDLEGNNIVAKVNKFYQGKMNELSSLGTQLRDVITESFNDGLLDIDEIEKITQLQGEMAEIQNALATSEFDANMQLLENKYSMGDLDAESFRNLQAEVLEQTEAAAADYEKSYILAVSNANVMKQEGSINQTEYEDMLAEFDENYRENMANLHARAAKFQTQTIATQYADEISNADVDSAIEQTTQYALQYMDATGNTSLLFNDKAIYNDMDLNLSKPAKDALSELWESMQPELEQMIKDAGTFREAGEEIPKELAEGIRDAAAIGALVGDKNSLYTLMGEIGQDNPEFREMILNLQEQGAYVPEQIAAGIRSNKQMVMDAIDELTQINAGTIDVAVKVSTSTKGNTSPAIDAHADGGIFDQPHLAWIAEAGYPETVIPIDGSKNAVDLWLKTGELLGMEGLTGGTEPVSEDVAEVAYSGTGTTEIHIDNSRVITINGSASKEDIDNALDDDMEKFERCMQAWMANNRRVKFW